MTRISFKFLCLESNTTERSISKIIASGLVEEERTEKNQKETVNLSRAFLMVDIIQLSTAYLKRDLGIYNLNATRETLRCYLNISKILIVILWVNSLLYHLSQYT